MWVGVTTLYLSLCPPYAYPCAYLYAPCLYVGFQGHVCMSLIMRFPEREHGMVPLLVDSISGGGRTPP